MNDSKQVDDGDDLDLAAIEKDLVAHDKRHVDGDEPPSCCARDQCDDIRLLIAEVERLRKLHVAIEGLEAVHGDDGNCSSAGGCMIGDVLAIIRTKEAETIKPIETVQ